MNETELDNIYNFVQISDRIATAGQPTEEQFAEISSEGYDVIVNLALPTSTNAISDEAEIVDRWDMKYIHIPVIWENPTLADFQQFVKVMDTYSEQKVLVHCAMNMRVSAFIYLYRRIGDRVEEEKAKQDLAKIWTPNEIWQAFMEKVQKYYEEKDKST
ncbi:MULTISPECIES: protein tyrosine phosphatase family protein [Spirulina sp. CCY15215]|uniref:protein tyrosine phosphatase family protein n=1 Tax=Spirulina sp. CCY15215 TaxID=2767591 RepID=UPI0019520E85|nr:protein tyrosine phosphatase family protein [Spirulina major]